MKAPADQPSGEDDMGRTGSRCFDEILVTAAMRRAGTTAFHHEFGCGPIEDVLERVYRAMERQRRDDLELSLTARLRARERPLD